MARKWTNKEREAWGDFIYGGVMFPPGNRTPNAVLTCLAANARGACLLSRADDHSHAALHAGSLAAIAVLKTQPFQSTGGLLRRADAIVAFACGDVAALARFAPDIEAASVNTTAELAFGHDEAAKAFHRVSDDVAHAAVIAARTAIQAVRRVEHEASTASAAA